MNPFRSAGLAAVCILVTVTWSVSAAGLNPQEAREQSETDTLVVAARAIMAAAKLCSLVTLDDSGGPQVRTMDPFAPDENMVVWFGTLRGSRKLEQIRNDPRVALHYMAPGGAGYVSIEGTARIVEDAAEKADRWKEAWEEFYTDRDADYVLIAVTPKTLRVLDYQKGIVADPETWKIPSVEFASAERQGIEGLKRIQGRRWEMDDHTRSMFAQMEASFSSVDLGAQEGDGLKTAGSGLQKDIDALIEGCTMTGDAHEQLHMYLAGFIPAVATLSESGRLEDGEKVQHYLEQYPEYFE